jgi:hypothetical protein
MFTMLLFGVSIVLILGIINLLLVVFQLLSGMRIIDVRPGTHRITGIILVVLAVIHGILGILANF